MKLFGRSFITFSAIISIVSLSSDFSKREIDALTIWNIVFLIYFSYWINKRIDSQKGNSNV